MMLGNDAWHSDSVLLPVSVDNTTVKDDDGCEFVFTDSSVLDDDMDTTSDCCLVTFCGLTAL